MVCLFRPTGRLRSPVAGLLLVASANGAQAAEEAASGMEGVQQQLDVQTRQIELMKRELQRQESALAELRRQLDLNRRGRGDTPPAVAQAAPAAESPRPVGQAPAAPERPPEVAPIFEQPGVLTPPGKGSSSRRCNTPTRRRTRLRRRLHGDSGDPDRPHRRSQREVQQLTGTLALRRGNHQPLRTGGVDTVRVSLRQYTWKGGLHWLATDEFFVDSSGRGLGDVELIGRYQLNDGGGDSPYYIASMRLKTRTGKDPFEVRTSFQADGARTSGVQEELPTGSGFYSLTPGLTVLIPSDPAVFFGGISYQYSFKRDNVTPNVVPDTARANYAEIQPGGVFGFNFGMGLALNERSSFSIGYDHLSVGKTDATFENALGPKAFVCNRFPSLDTLQAEFAAHIESVPWCRCHAGHPDVQLTLRTPPSF